VFDPFDMTTIEVRYRGVPHGLAIPHRITRHSHPKARPETSETEPPKPTGIDYLGIIAATDQSATGVHINYDAIARHDTGAGPEQTPPTATATQAIGPDPALENELAGFAALARDLTPANAGEATGPDTDQIPVQLDLIDLLSGTDQQNGQQNGQVAS
jgi:hypothetical protein